MTLDPLLGKIRKPVRREGARRHLLLTLLAFAFSVAGTRLFLEITGYPQLGGGDLHIAHVLWGGLLLFGAALLPLIFANRWAYTAGALLAGLGVGLFIDEVGKFITQSNDYFYPAAAPIIYAFFMLTVLIYLNLRRPGRRDPRSSLYRALDSIEEILDRDLQDDERKDLELRLRAVVQQSEEPALRQLAYALLVFLRSDAVKEAYAPPGFWTRTLQGMRAWIRRTFTRPRLRRALAGGLALAALLPLVEFIQLLQALADPGRMERLLRTLLDLSPVSSIGGFRWFVVSSILEGTVGALLILSSILLLLGLDRAGTAIAYYGLLLALTVVDFLVFYFDQFSTILLAVMQLLLFLGVQSYRRRFISRTLTMIPNRSKTRASREEDRARTHQHAAGP